MVSNDPVFETKAADVISLYLKPPAHAAVRCVDEKTAIQALDRKDRMLPLSTGRVGEWRGHFLSRTICVGEGGHSRYDFSRLHRRAKWTRKLL